MSTPATVPPDFFALPEKACLWCGKVFVPRVSAERFCSKQCRHVSARRRVTPEQRESIRKLAAAGLRWRLIASKVGIAPKIFEEVVLRAEDELAHRAYSLGIGENADILAAAEEFRRQARRFTQASKQHNRRPAARSNQHE